MLDPDSGRVSVLENDQGLKVVIPAKRHLFLAGFMGFWLCGWAFGWFVWYVAAGALLSGGAGAASLFIFVWLGAWTIGGLLALGTFLWFVAGVERISITAQTITVSRVIPIWRKSVTCAAERVHNLRTTTAETSSRFQSRQMGGLFASRSEGTIKFDYGVHTIGFGLELDQAEADKVVEMISNRFPELWQKP